MNVIHFLSTIVVEPASAMDLVKNINASERRCLRGWSIFEQVILASFLNSDLNSGLNSDRMRPPSSNSLFTISQEGYPMERLKNLLKKPGLHLFLFCLGLVLLSWPLITIANETISAGIFIYLFLIWCIMVLLLFLIAISHNIRGLDETKEKKKEGVDV